MRYALALIISPCLAHAEPLTWDWQLSTPYDLSQHLDAIDLDPESVTAAQMTDVIDRVPLRICYVSVGTREDWRTDLAAFPADVIGDRYDEWPDERFLDIRQIDTLLPIMRSRFQRCIDLGFNAVEPDNMDTHDDSTGFPLSQDDMIRYIRSLADVAHGMGLKIGQKNTPALTQVISSEMDFAIVESCLSYDWCGDMAPYFSAGKPVFGVEYDIAPINHGPLCALAAGYGISLIFKDEDLRAGGANCQ